MRRRSGPLNVGLHTHLPTLCAETRRRVKWVPMGNPVYFITQPDVTDEFLEVIGLTDLSQLTRIDVRWEDIRMPSIRMIPSSISERCWHATREDMETALKAIREKLVVPGRDEFAPEVDLD